ncbi:toprim domain-containing protein [Leuconostocaceae bacterium ESL0958]|nr:toprim domain-containing protein [Leuconostocaceae bacterium ESL0958]
MNYKERVAVLKEARQMSVISIAEALGMDLQKQGRVFTWREHDSFVLDPKKNIFYWNSRGFGGDGIRLVETIKECDFTQATEFLATVNGKPVEAVANTEKKDFKYKLKEHHSFNAASNYLEQERGLNKETIQFFKDQGLLAQAPYKNFQTNESEPVLIFKSLVQEKVAAISVQGLWKKDDYSRGRLKKIQGDGQAGFQVALGQLPDKPSAANPLKIIAFEAPIDLMSYHQLFHEKLDGVLLVAMNGLKKGVISQSIANQIDVDMDPEKKPKLLDAIEEHHFLEKGAVKIALAVDNDQAGREFVQNFGTEYVEAKAHLPKNFTNAEKVDWNDLLKAVQTARPNQTASRPNYASSYQAKAKAKQQHRPVMK